MELRKLGTSDLQVPIVGLGCNNFGGRIDLEATRKVIDTAIDLGITHFDTADVYGGGGKSEEFIGQLLGDRRQKVILATKFGKLADGVPGTRGTRAYVLKCAEASLKRLRTDHIDLYYMHESDPETPIAETLAALAELKKAGKIQLTMGTLKVTAVAYGSSVTMPCTPKKNKPLPKLLKLTVKR